MGLLSCPVCGSEELQVKPYETWPPPDGMQLSPPYEDLLGQASYEVCPNCGFEFGNDDNPGTAPPQSFEDYRAEWQSRGSPRFAEEYGRSRVSARSPRQGSMATLDAVRERIHELAAVIGAPRQCLPTYGRSEQSGKPHIEVTTDGRMHWVVCERGSEYERRTTLKRDELLYWTFQAVTHEMASKYEVQHRIPSEDFRKQMFTKQFELLDQLNPAWTERRKQELGPLRREAGL
jgi:hypothetical protein